MTMDTLPPPPRARKIHRIYLQDHANAILGTGAPAGGAAATAVPPSLTAAMLEAGASEVVEPGFAQLLDIVPPLAAGGESARGLGPAAAGSSTGGNGEEKVIRRAAISRWVGGWVTAQALGC